MIREDLNLSSFLSYYSKAETHIESTHNVECVPIRSGTIENMIASNKPLLVTAINQGNNTMILYPDDIMSLLLSESNPIGPKYGKPYTIMRFAWKPICEIKLKYISDLYGLANKHLKMIKEIRYGAED